MVALALLSMIAEIMASPKFAEICFGIAVLLIAVVVIMEVTSRPNPWPYTSLLMALAVGFIALGFLALPTGGNA